MACQLKVLVPELRDSGPGPDRTPRTGPSKIRKPVETHTDSHDKRNKCMPPLAPAVSVFLVEEFRGPPPSESAAGAEQGKERSSLRKKSESALIG
ncbi:UNVERIFIED_CONTAM: hypothetical protein PYX00_009233 [Menopon gallinae]|uniref:Uncharacterized protein n=1 Tax=Menopon gallinae TaxID=328185 RepID=A0AAW2HAJ1_9NEOP